MAATAGETRTVLTVFKVKHAGKTTNGNSIFEMTTDRGKFRTTANSQAGTVLNSRVYATGQRMAVVITARGTIREVAGRGRA